jgi:Mrr N-terminal domain
MRQIFLAESTYNRLLKLVTSFEDQPEDVIIRLLNEADTADPALPAQEPKPARRAAPGSVLPVENYWVPILQVIDEAGGSAPANDVVDALEERMGKILTERDYEPLRSGEIRWRNRARFARLRMKEQGLLSDTSRRGVWAITELGRNYLAFRNEEAKSD